MYNILFVDDEKKTLLRLQKILEEIDIIFANSFFSNDANEALDIYKKNNIDIVISDINMPNKNGLSLIKEMQCFSGTSNKYFVLLTVKKSFVYAHEAIALGVADYIVKPVRKNQLEDVLNKIVQKIETHNSEVNYIGTLKKELSEIKKENENHFFSLICLGCYYSDREIKINIPNFQNIHYVQLAKVVLPNNQDSKKYHQVIQAFVEQNDNSDCFRVFRDIYNHIYICSLTDELQLSTSIYTVAKKIALLIQKTDSIKIEFIIGNTYSTIWDLKKSYFELLKSSTLSTINSIDEQISTYSDYVKIEDILTKENRYKLINYIRKNKIVDVGNCITIFFESNLSNQQLLFFELLEFGLEFIFDQKINILEAFDTSYKTLQRFLQNTDSIHFLETILSLFSKINYLLIQEHFEAEKNICLLAKKFVENNFYDKQLSVRSISEHLYINSNYLSFQFKKQFGIPLNQYINDLRLNQAEKLILQKNFSLADIADLCGFNDALYFSKRFKKKFGVTPSKYGSV